MEEKHFNGLTPGEAERLAILAEEMAEAIQVVGKILRHGYDSVNPLIEGAASNRAELEKELGDVAVAIGMLECFKDVSSDNIDARTLDKSKKIIQWLHHIEMPAAE